MSEILEAAAKAFTDCFLRNKKEEEIPDFFELHWEKDADLPEGLEDVALHDGENKDNG